MAELTRTPISRSTPLIVLMMNTWKSNSGWELASQFGYKCSILRYLTNINPSSPLNTTKSRQTSTNKHTNAQRQSFGFNFILCIFGQSMTVCSSHIPHFFLYNDLPSYLAASKSNNNYFIVIQLLLKQFGKKINASCLLHFYKHEILSRCCIHFWPTSQMVDYFEAEIKSMHKILLTFILLWTMDKKIC